MAQQTTSDTALLTIYKSWYTDKRFPNLLFRNSPTMRKIQKNRFQGKEYRFAALYGRGGATSGDYTRAVALAASMSKNAEFAVKPGNIFSVFTVTQKEILASQSKQGAYVKALINRMFAATEGARKLLAASLFGWGYGDVGQLPTAVAAAATSMTLNWDTIVKLDVGMGFYVINSATPAGGTYDTTLRTISAIDGTTVTWTGGAATAGGWAAGSWLVIDGGQDGGSSGSGSPNMPTGFAQWIPNLGKRATSDWTTYIATSFYGVTRSSATGPLAGWHYTRAGGETKADAIVQGLKMARRGGGVPDMIVMNDEDFSDLMIEMQQNMTYYQMTNASPEKKDTNEVVRGLSAFRASFSKSFVDILYEDPYCPKGTCYILDSEAIEFVALNNVAAADDGIPNNEPGSQSVESQSEPDTSFKLLIDDYINIAPNSSSAEGPAAQVSLSFYGNWVVHEPGHCAVISF